MDSSLLLNGIDSQPWLFVVSRVNTPQNRATTSGRIISVVKNARASSYLNDAVIRALNNPKLLGKKHRFDFPVVHQVFLTLTLF